MNTRLLWLASEVLPALSSLYTARRQYHAIAYAASEEARATAVRSQYRMQEAEDAYNNLRQLLLGCGYTNEELDQFEKGTTAPTDPPLCDCDREEGGES